ncbi:MAG: Gfo/Idh/MocA family oxidoreductase [Caldilineales bacterium]|nr:Gfo/Idh/MocA family oxidoreductase [Caldilineales bacterium]
MKIIQMGVGRFGMYWLRTLSELPEVEVVAVVDASESALETCSNTFGLEASLCYTTLEAALAAAQADMMLCITPPAYHREHVTAAMNAGLHVLCEKPIAYSLDDCMAMLETSQNTGKSLAVSQQYRYRPDMLKMARLVAKGKIGQVGQIRLDFYKGWYFESDNFRQYMAHPLLIDMSVHHFDLVRAITGHEAVDVLGSSWNPKWSDNAGDTSVNLTFTLSNGSHFAYNASWCTQGDFCNWNGNWLIDGDEGSILYQNDRIVLGKAAGKYQLASSKQVKPVKMKQSDQVYLLSHFIESVKKGRLPDTNIADNIRSIGMAFAAVEAADSGQRVQVLSPEIDAHLREYVQGWQMVRT